MCKIPSDQWWWVNLLIWNVYSHWVLGMNETPFFVWHSTFKALINELNNLIRVIFIYSLLFILTNKGRGKHSQQWIPMIETLSFGNTWKWVCDTMHLNLSKQIQFRFQFDWIIVARCHHKMLKFVYSNEKLNIVTKHFWVRQM